MIALLQVVALIADVVWTVTSAQAGHSWSAAAGGCGFGGMAVSLIVLWRDD